MTSGNYRRRAASALPILALMLMLPCTRVYASDSASPSAREIITALKQPPPASTPFTEVRFLGMLDRPLLVSGQLSWGGGQNLKRQVDKPYRETSTIADGEVTVEREGRAPRHLSLQRVPALQALLDSFVALLGGDADALMRRYTVSVHGDKQDWQLLLVPRQLALRSHVARIEMDGHGQQPRCLVVDEGGGDTSFTLLGSAATQARKVAPVASAYAAYCGSFGG